MLSTTVMLKDLRILQFGHKLLLLITTNYTLLWEKNSVKVHAHAFVFYITLQSTIKDSKPVKEDTFMSEPEEVEQIFHLYDTGCN